MAFMDDIRGIAADPAAYARQWRQKTGGRVVGHFCSYTPEEVLWAAGALPVRLFGQANGVSAADAHLQAYCCSLVRTALEDALTGRLDFLDATVFPHTCDSIQRLSDIWRLNTSFGRHIDLVLPVKLDTPSARVYMVDVMNKFIRDVSEAFGTAVTDPALRAAAATVNRIRKGLGRLYEMRSRMPGLISGQDMHALMRAAMVMDRNDFADGVDQLADRLGEQTTAPAVERKRLLVAGGVCNMPDLHGAVEAAGGEVVWDDLCTGSRYVQGAVDARRDIVTALADRYLDRVVCPAKFSGLQDRAGHLVDAAKAHGVHGIIFFFLKFCDPHAFDYPYLKAALDREGLPSIRVEIEEQSISAGQLQTRLEAFMELL